jgi:hypothetical protein
MRNFLVLSASIFLVLISACNNLSNNQHDGSYAMSIVVFGVSVNSKPDLIVNGDKAKFNGEIYECKQFSDRIEIGDNKITLSAVEGDLIVNVPSMGKVRYIKLSGKTNINEE